MRKNSQWRDTKREGCGDGHRKWRKGGPRSEEVKKKGGNKLRSSAPCGYVRQKKPKKANNFTTKTI